MVRFLKFRRFPTLVQVIVGQGTERTASDGARSHEPRRQLRKLWLAVALFAAAGCASMPLPMVPKQVVGRWDGSKDGAKFEMTDTGIFVVELMDGTTLIGRSSFALQRGTLRYQIGAAHCPQEPGEYTFVVDGSTLTTSDPADTCEERRALMDQPWTRASH